MRLPPRYCGHLCGSCSCKTRPTCCVETMYWTVVLMEHCWFQTALFNPTTDFSLKSNQFVFCFIGNELLITLIKKHNVTVAQCFEINFSAN